MPGQRAQKTYHETCKPTSSLSRTPRTLAPATRASLLIVIARHHHSKSHRPLHGSLRRRRRTSPRCRSRHRSPRCSRRKRLTTFSIRQGSNELDRSCSRERSSPVMLSAAKHLAADCDRPFASLRVTGCDESTCQGLFFTIEPCLRKIFRNYLHRLPLLWSCSQGSSIARSEEIDYHVQT